MIPTTQDLKVQEQLEQYCSHIGPKDNRFTARMRFHQSWYRKYVLRLPPGPNPHANNELYGNMLRENDGLAGKNFYNKEIHAYVEKRLAEDSIHIEPSRLHNNLLSSQPFCFNIFAPLALDKKLAMRLLKSILGWPNLSQVTRVEIEYAPPKELMLNDGTSFDAWIEYKLDNGRYGFIGIETKLTEPFSQKHYDFKSSYGRWMKNPSWWWNSGAEVQFSNRYYNQLWRNHLLAFALQYQPDSKYSESFSAVLHHPDDKHCYKAINSYRELLLPNGQPTLLEWSLDELCGKWTQQVETGKEKYWLKALYSRYLYLDASEPLWQQYRRTK
jgi:hypothetical protein